MTCRWCQVSPPVARSRALCTLLNNIIKEDLAEMKIWTHESAFYWRPSCPSYCPIRLYCLLRKKLSRSSSSYDVSHDLQLETPSLEMPGLNLGPSTCQTCVLPLGYGPSSFFALQGHSKELYSGRHQGYSSVNVQIIGLLPGKSKVTLTLEQLQKSQKLALWLRGQMELQPWTPTMHITWNELRSLSVTLESGCPRSTCCI